MEFFDWLRDLGRTVPKRYSMTEILESDLRGNPRPEGYERPSPKEEVSLHRVPELLREMNADPLPHHVFFGGRWIPFRELRHTFFAGTTGAGKSKQLLILLSALSREVRDGSNVRLLIVGSKTDALEMLSGMGVRHVVINLEDPESPGWDIAADYDTPYLIEELAHIFIPNEKSNDPFWQNTARSIVSGILRSFNLRHGTDWGFHDLMNAMMGDFSDIIQILDQHPNNRAIVGLLTRTEIEKTKLGILMQGLSQLAKLLPFAAHCQKARYQVSIKRDFLRSEDIWLIQPNPENMAAVTPVIHAMFKAVTEKLSGLMDSEERRTFVLLDEAQYLGRIPGVEKFAEFTRSKGGVLILSTQTIDGLYEHYGEYGAPNLLGLFPYKSIMRLDTALSVEWALRCFGSLEVWESGRSRSETALSVSKGESSQWQVRQRLQDSDIRFLPLASRRTGIESLYIVPETPESDPNRLTAYRYVTPPSLVESLTPRGASRPVPRTKVSADYILSPWTEDEWMKFVRPDDRESYEYYEAKTRAKRRLIEEILNEHFGGK